MKHKTTAGKNTAVRVFRRQSLWVILVWVAGACERSLLIPIQLVYQCSIFLSTCILSTVSGVKNFVSSKALNLGMTRLLTKQPVAAVGTCTAGVVGARNPSFHSHRLTRLYHISTSLTSSLLDPTTCRIYTWPYHFSQITTFCGVCETGAFN